MFAKDNTWVIYIKMHGASSATAGGLEEVKKRIAELSATIDGLETCNGKPSASSTAEMPFLFTTTRPGYTDDWRTPGTTEDFAPFSCAYVTGDAYSSVCLHNYRGTANGNGMGRVCYRKYEGEFRKMFEIWLYYEDESKWWNNCERWDIKVKEALGDVKDYKWVRNNTPVQWNKALHPTATGNLSLEDANAGACVRDASGVWKGSLGGLCDYAINKHTHPLAGGLVRRHCTSMPANSSPSPIATPYYTCSSRCGCPAIWTAVCMDDSCIYNGATGPFYPPGPNAGGSPPI